MSKPSILLQLDTDPQPSVFDSVVAVDSGVDHLLRHGGITPQTVRDLVYGTIFTRGTGDLSRTAIFIGGSNVIAGEALLAAVQKVFFGPMRVSVMLDSGGANTTAVAAVLAAKAHLALDGAEALVLAATGPVGARVVRLLASQGSRVRIGSRDPARAEAVCQAVRQQVPQAKLQAVATDSPQALSEAVRGVTLIVAAGAPGVELLSAGQLAQADSLRVAIDLSAVAPAGIGGIEVADTARQRGAAICYGALGVGGVKMKIHKAAVRRLFTANDQILDAEAIFAIGQDLIASASAS
jgi:methylenetetrahydrofolate/methylenetetrahydromethanopterin dehydrogenase (NADP+)